MHAHMHNTYREHVWNQRRPLPYPPNNLRTVGDVIRRLLENAPLIDERAQLRNLLKINKRLLRVGMSARRQF